MFSKQCITVIQNMLNQFLHSLEAEAKNLFLYYCILFIDNLKDKLFKLLNESVAGVVFCVFTYMYVIRRADFTLYIEWHYL